MRISTRIWIAVSAILTIAALAIKFYFLPAVERFNRLTIEEQMQRDMVAFEKVLAVVATAADKNMDFVRRSFRAISEEKGIHVELRRDKILDEQFGKKDDYAQNDFEREALRSRKPAFREHDGNIEYVYPLKAQKLCQSCHVTAEHKPVALGQPLGLALRKLPLSVFTDSPISYFTLDLFWQNFALLAFCMLALIVPVWFWILRPLQRLADKSDAIVHRRDMANEEDKVSLIPETEQMPEEWRSIRRIIDDAHDKH